MRKRITLDMQYPSKVLKSRLRSVGGFYPEKYYLSKEGLAFATKLSDALYEAGWNYSIPKGYGMSVRAHTFGPKKVSPYNVALMMPFVRLENGGEVSFGGLIHTRTEKEKTVIDIMFHEVEV